METDEAASAAAELAQKHVTDSLETTTRLRTLTEKGRIYSKQVFSSQRSRLWKSVEKHMNEIDELLKVSDNVSYILSA